MKYAIIKTGSSQLKIQEGDKIKVLGFTDKPDFEVLFYSDGKDVILDGDKLKDVSINSKSLSQGRERKLTVGRFKSKSRYDKQRGFRAQFTEFLISSISLGKADKKSESNETSTLEKETVKPKKTTKSTETKPVKASKTSKKLESSETK